MTARPSERRPIRARQKRHAPRGIVAHPGDLYRRPVGSRFVWRHARHIPAQTGPSSDEPHMRVSGGARVGAGLRLDRLAVFKSRGGSLCSVSELVAPVYQPLVGDRHRHRGVEHSHPHRGPHTHHGARHAHSHSHGLIDESIKRSRAGVHVVLVSLAILSVTAAAQAVIYIATGSVALLADLIHNAGDALTALPLGAAFLLRSARAERGAGVAVVATILLSAVGAGFFAVVRIVHPLAPTHLLALGLAGGAGVIGNAIAARVRLAGGRRLESPALIADGNHARSDAIVSAGVVLTAVVVALGAPIADPIIGLAISALILQITWESWITVRHRH